MSDGTNVLDVIECLALLVPREAALWVTRVDSFQNAQTSEVLDSDLQHFQALGTPNECRFQPSIILLLLLSHTRQLSLGSHLGMARRLDGRLLRTTFYTISHLYCLLFSRSR